jgi:hypothetical protein
VNAQAGLPPQTRTYAIVGSNEIINRLLQKSSSFHMYNSWRWQLSKAALKINSGHVSAERGDLLQGSVCEQTVTRERK